MRSFHHADFPADWLRAEREETISVCVPAREEAGTIVRVVAPLVALRDEGVVDQVVVVDADSRDGTAAIAAECGAEVHSQEALLPEFGPVVGKGDAMWRSLSVLGGDLVCFVDADTENFAGHFVCGVVGPLVCDVELAFVKGHFRRPFKHDGLTQPDGGGRVTALTAIPLLRAFYPELASFHQPLAGEMAGRRDLLLRLPFSTGYAVEMALLLDVYAEVGIEAMAQVDLDVRQNRHQPLAQLTAMADEVLGAVTDRLSNAGRLVDGESSHGILRRPPLAELGALRR
jgi:glucosyl-3-phosphoglycerate synthase